MNVSYYPGCSLDGTAREYGESTRAVARRLDINLNDLEDWNCCGASSAHATSRVLALGLARRNLDIAHRAGLDLVVPCASCYHQLKQTEAKNGGNGKLKIRYSLDFFWEDIGEASLRARVKKSLYGLNPVCYYGCLATRPPRITGAKNPEAPQAMDNILKTLGIEARNWSYKTDCCGGNLTFTRPDIAAKLTAKILDMAEEAGADSIVTGCPLCQSNLDIRQDEVSIVTGKKYKIPVIYFTELMGLAFGDSSANKWLGRHMIDPRPLLKQKGLL